MDISNTLFQSLLKQQGYAEFCPVSLQMAGESKNIYGYFMDEYFHLCDEELEEIPFARIGVSEDKTLLLSKLGESYTFIERLEQEDFADPWVQKPHNWVIGRDGLVLLKDVDYFRSLTPILQIVKNSSRLMPLPVGSTYQFSTDVLYIPQEENSEGYVTAHCINWSFNRKPEGILFNGEFISNCVYLFCIDGLYYFHKDYSLWVINKHGDTVFQGHCNAIWNSPSGVNIVSLAIADSDETDNRFYTIRNGKVSCQIMEDSPHGWAYGMNSGDCLGMSASMLLHARHNTGFGNWSLDLVIVGSEGKIECYHSYYKAKVLRCAHNLILLEDEERADILLDRYGNEIGYGERSSSHSFLVFKQVVESPVRFNEVELAAHSESGNDEVRYGVLNIWTGEVLIPCNYSKIEMAQGQNGILLSIVSITNYYRGEKSVYQGLYVNDRLILPVGCEDISFMYCKIKDYLYSDKPIMKRRSYLRFIRNGKYGLVYDNGVVVTEGCDEVAVLGSECGCSDCAVAARNGKYAYLYKDKVITGFVFNRVELLPVEGWYDSETQWVKVWRGNECAVYRNEEPVVGYYTDIRVVNTHLFPVAEDSRYSNVLFVVTLEDGKQGLYNMDDEVILPCHYASIDIKGKLVCADDEYIDGTGSVVFKSENYELLTKVQGRYGLTLCYANHEDIVFVETGTGEVKNCKRGDNRQQYSCGAYVFDFMSERFVLIEEETDEDTDNNPAYYEDDYDYERDTYYALGGDDYDRWRDGGGNLDDMMDGMGF
ncbi:hypothetical protein [uncultured Bacteroides sp.]|uniref:hypothetical protein n=1 Tax=uncultured Bacteroides sp. TaxID=162156 RepID=UPI0026380580|nr:hypothetical protein [uncultured Bacteroides sp.]